MMVEYTYKCDNCGHTEKVSENEVYRTKGVSNCRKCGNVVGAKMTFIVPKGDAR